MDPYFEPQPLDTKVKSDACYSQDIRAEVFDAMLGAMKFAGGEEERLFGDLEGDFRDEFLAALWCRGYEVVPRQ